MNAETALLTALDRGDRAEAALANAVGDCAYRRVSIQTAEREMAAAFKALIDGLSKRQSKEWAKEVGAAWIDCGIAYFGEVRQTRKDALVIKMRHLECRLRSIVVMDFLAANFER